MMPLRHKDTKKTKKFPLVKLCALVPLCQKEYDP